ncbi:MAG: hypothetical protein WAU36_04265 [Cyclobacteriaceae bacterium]
MENESNGGDVIVKRYFTQRNMNRPIYFYGLTGIQTVGLALTTLMLYLVVGNLGPVFILILFPFLQKNKKKLSEGDPNYIDTIMVRNSTRVHYQDTDRVLRKIGKKWLKD